MTSPTLDVAQLLSLLRSGAHVDVAYRAVGLSTESFEEIVGDDEELRASIERARAEGEIANVLLIARAARNGNWLAASWLLERQYPDRYARPAVRQEEKPTQLPSGADRLDDLADRRARRRAGSDA